MVIINSNTGESTDLETNTNNPLKIKLVQKLYLCLNSIISEFGEENGMDTEEYYMEVDAAYDDAIEIFEDYSLDDLQEYLEDPEEYIDGMVQYRKGIESTLYNLTYFENELDTNQTSFLNTECHTYNEGRINHTWEGLHGYIEEIVNDKQLNSNVDIIYGEFENSLDDYGSYDSSKLSKDALIIEKEIDWLSGNFIKGSNDSFNDHWSDYIVDNSINHNVLKKYTVSLKNHIDEINIFLTMDYPERVI